MSCQLVVYDTSTNSQTVVYETSALIEAPNWSPDGRWLIVNKGGLLYRIAADGTGGLVHLDTGAVRDSNNDHVVAPDGRFIYLSSGNGHLYVIPSDGGQARRVTDASDGLDARYLHGISPDGKTLVFIGRQRTDSADRFNIYTAPSTGGTVTALTDSPHHHDGAEYSPDGTHIYFNSDRASTLPGHAQLFRMRTDGTEISQLTFDERVNWFAHLSSDGTTMLYLSFEPGVQGHPANQPVQLRVAAPDGANPRTLVTLTGGQGTVNVNSWAADSTRFAFVAY